MHLIKKNDWDLFNGLNELYDHAKFGCRCKNMVFVTIFVFLSVMHRGRRVGHSLSNYCVTVYGLILMQFSSFFWKSLPCQMNWIVRISVARWCHNFWETGQKL